MQNEKELHPAVLLVLHEMEEVGDARLPIMRKLVRNEDVFVNMWRQVLRVERREPYISMSEAEVIYCFLDAAIDSTREEIPVFYLGEKKKKAAIKKIRGYESKLKQSYEALFAKEAVPFLEALHANSEAAIKKIEDSYLRASGAPKIRKIHTFVRELAQKTLWIYGEQLHSVIRTAVQAVYGYTINHDANILKITKSPEEKHLSLEEVENLLSGQ